MADISKIKPNAESAEFNLKDAAARTNIGDLTNLETENKEDLVSAINEIIANFQDGVDDVYDAVVAKGTTPASKSLSDVVQGIADIETATIHTETYTASSRASNLDMGESHEYRYVNTNSVPNTNASTYDVTSNGTKDMGSTNTNRYVNVNVPNTNASTYSVDSNGIKDMGATNSYRYVNVNVPHPTHTTTYKPTSRASNNDMGATHLYRYVDTTAVPNSNSGTYTGATSNGVKDMGATNTYRYVNVQVPNSNSGTYGSVTSNGVKDMGATNSYRYVNVQVPHPTHTTTYTPTSRASNLDMGATHSYRYVNTNSVPNTNSGTYTYGSGSTGGTVDMGATNTYRYVNASNVYSKGKSDGQPTIITKTFHLSCDNKYQAAGWSGYTGYRAYLISATNVLSNSTGAVRQGFKIDYVMDKTNGWHRLAISSMDGSSTPGAEFNTADGPTVEVMLIKTN